MEEQKEECRKGWTRSGDKEKSRRRKGQVEAKGEKSCFVLELFEAKTDYGV